LTRQFWEYSEAWLFGPVSTESIDPSIDTWPIDNQIIASMCQQSHTWTDSLINVLDGSQKGFHAVEYLLYGENGNKSAIDFTAGELNLLVALARNLNFQCHNLFLNWNASSDAYHLKLLNTPNNLYNNQAVVLIEMGQALGAICDEVANSKIQEVLIGQDKMAVESPFSSNSMADFKNNVNGVNMVYNGANTNGGKGLSQVVKLFNLDLDRRIQSAILASEYALNQVSVPFEQAIFTQPVQLQNAVDQLLILQELLNTELVQLIQKQYQ
jgi:predicted lipoprotein